MGTAKKLSLAGVLGLLLIGGGWYGLHRMLSAWQYEPGVTLEFEMTNPKADMDAELRAVRERLSGVTHKIVTKTSAARFTVWIPYPEALQQAEARRAAALDDFRKVELTPARIDGLLRLKPLPRAAEIDRLAPAGTALREPLLKLAAAFDLEDQTHLAAATSTAPATRAAALIARDVYFAALDEVLSRSLDARRFEELLAAADDPANTAAQKVRDELLASHPAQATEILHVIDARRAWRSAGGDMTIGPGVIADLLLAAGELEFRIAPTEISSADSRLAADSLHVHGPAIPVRISAGPVRWFEIASAHRGNFGGPLVIENWAGREYLLCCDDHDHTLTHNDPLRKPWTISAAPPARESQVRVDFRLDAAGAGYMEYFSERNGGHPMAVLVDDQALSAPTLQAQISAAGQITFGQPTAGHPASAIFKEAQDLARALNQPPLPSPLRRIH